MVQSYNLHYYDKSGNFKPVRFVSYIWKFIDGLILASLRKELRHEKQRITACWDGEEYDVFERIPAGNDPIIPVLL